MFNIVNFDCGYRSDGTLVTSASSDNGPRKRKGSYIDPGSNDDEESSKNAKTSANWSKKQNHSEVEKRRRDKMNTYIMELSSILPVCSSQKLDKLTVLRMAVQQMKLLQGSVNSYIEGHYKPSFLTDEELKNLILQNELLGTSWFDLLHPKDLNKIKEQISCSNVNIQDKFFVQKTLLLVKSEASQGSGRLSPGSRRAFFCRMRCKSTTFKEEENLSTRNPEKLQNLDKKYKDVHFTGYLKTWTPIRDSAEEESDVDMNSCTHSCLVAVGRVHYCLASVYFQNSLSFGRNHLLQPIEFISKLTIDGKFVYVDKRASLMFGWLPQEFLGSSIYEYFHDDDIPGLIEIHKSTLQSQSVQSTKIYRFRCRDGLFIKLKSFFQTFRNPWTKDVEFIITRNKLILPITENESRDCLLDSESSTVTSESLNYILDSASSIQTSKIGSQVANEVLDSRRCGNSSPVVLANTFEDFLDMHNNDSYKLLINPALYDKNSTSENVSESSNGYENDHFMPSISDQCSGDQVNNHSNYIIESEPNKDMMSSPNAENKLSLDDFDETTITSIINLLEVDAGLNTTVDISQLSWPLP